MSRVPEAACIVAGAIAGLAGVALSAVAAHVTGPGSLDVAARFLLAHAPALVGVAALLQTDLVGRRSALVAALLLVIGLLLFCGDLSVRALAGIALVPMAAPTGGMLLMGGWAMLAVAGVIGALRPRGGG